MTTEAAQVVAAAREDAARRDEQTRRVDYDALTAWCAVSARR